MYVQGEHAEVGDIVMCVDGYNTGSRLEFHSTYAVAQVGAGDVLLEGQHVSWRGSRFKLIRRATPDAIDFAERQRAAIAKALEDLEAAHMSRKQAQREVDELDERIATAFGKLDQSRTEAEAAYDRLERARAGDLD